MAPPQLLRLGLVVGWCFGAWAGSPLTLLSASGGLAAKSDMASALAGAGSAPRPVVSVISRRFLTTSPMADALLATSFGEDPQDGGVALACADVDGPCVVLNANLQASLAGGDDDTAPVDAVKVAELCAQVSDVVCVNTAPGDLEEGMGLGAVAVQAVLRRLAETAAANSSAEGAAGPATPATLPKLVVVVHLPEPEAGEEPPSSASVQSLAVAAVRRSWEEVAGPDVELEQAVDYTVVVLSPSAAMGDAASALRASVARARVLTTADAAVLSESIAEVWADMAQATPSAWLTSAERASLARIDSATDIANRMLALKFNAFYARTGEGKLVGSFGTRAAAALDGALEAFDRATLGTVMPQQRLERRTSVSRVYAQAAQALLQEQLKMIQADTKERFRRSMMDLARGSAQYSEKDAMNELRKAVLWFEARAKGLRADALGLSVDVPHEEISSALQEFMNSFKRSPEYRIEAMSKMDKAVRRKNQKALKWKLTLVGMLRPMGQGNMQGFLGFAAHENLSFMGGFANDGESRSVLSAFSGMEVPLLRIQPRLSVDVDV